MNNKVRVQLLNDKDEVIEEVDVITSANAVIFADGDTFEDKLSKGLLKGEKGEQGQKGVDGKQGIQGPPGKDGKNGLDGDGLKYGSTLSNATEVKLFLKKI